MGVRGLTTFIAKNAHRYLRHHELHDTYLVVDGNNIASQLYRWHCIRNDCFGGDYDKYAKAVYDFFKLLEDCKVIPVVIFDGGYEDKKLKTVFTRYRDKVKAAKNLNSVTQSSITMFPLFLREVFIDIVLKLELRTIRCDFEADYEMACLARNLNCPVLSYDSDFYVFGVLYIPFSSFEMSLYKLKNSTPGFCIHCTLYRVENFLKLYGGISKSNLPLIATLLGNDYINKKVFNSFYKHIKLPKRNHTRSKQQRKIISVIKWLQNETYDSAVVKILSRLKTKRRNYVAKQIKLVTEGYVCNNSKFLEYLKITPAKENISTTSDVPSIDPVEALDNIHTEPESDNEDITSESSEESGSDNSDISLNFLELGVREEYEEEEKATYDIPDWFINKYRSGNLPAGFMDILVKKIYFFPPQLEDYSNIYSHHISVPILSAINKILSSGTVETLTYVARAEKTGVKKYTTPSCNVNLPTLNEIPNIKMEDAKKFLLEILDIDCEVVTFLNKLPCNWQLYILSMIYWIKNAKPFVTYCHIYSIILCMVVLTTVDPQIGYCRSSSKFFNKFEKRLSTLSNSSSKGSNDAGNNKSDVSFVMILNDVTYDDCLLCMKELIKYFQMEEKMKTYLKLFDIHILDCFAQFQSCLLHIKYLNALLNKPFDAFLISDFYDGTFIYNMCVNFMKRNHIDAYISVLLKSSASLLRCSQTLAAILIEMLPEDIQIYINNVRKRRRKKKKNNTKEVVTDTTHNEIESEDNELVDVNNRFSLLNLVK